MDRQTKKDLEATIEYLKRQVSEEQFEKNSIIRKLRIALGNPEKPQSFNTTSREYSEDELFAKVAQHRSMIKTNVAKSFDVLMENSKLWYMMRIALNDKTIERENNWMDNSTGMPTRPFNQV